MAKQRIGLDLMVTYRKNVKTSDANEWKQITIDEYLDIIEFDKDLKLKSDALIEKMDLIERTVTSSDEMVDDYVITPKNLSEPFKTEYRATKLMLSCVNYFGKFTPPSNKISMDGEGNGIVVLDVDVKHLGADEGIHSAFKETLEYTVVEFFIEHPSTIFLYESSSRLGYHIGYLTDARNEVGYKQAFKQLAVELSEAISVFKKQGVIDESVGRYNANFFTNHSPNVYRKKPVEIFKHTPVLLSEPIVPEQQEEEQEYDDFPYLTDFRLFLAYQRRENGSFFNDRREWVTMMYALKAEYPICYRSRMVDWFIRLSALSQIFDEGEDLKTFDALLAVPTEKKAGVDFIVKVLSNGGALNQTPRYALDDLKHYFDDLGDEDAIDPSASNFVFINSYLTEIKQTLNFDKSLIIESPPNTGKSTLFLKEVSFKRIYLVPTKVLLTDLAKNVPSALIVQEGVLSDEIVAKEIILSTYESFPKILQSPINLKDYKLILDEAHNLFLSSSPSFRFIALHRICSSFSKFKNVILLSGTWIDLPFSDKGFKPIKVRQRHPVSTELNVITTETPLNNLSRDVAAETGKQIVLINDKDKNIELKALVLDNRPDATITLMNSDTKKSEEVKTILNDNHLRDGHVLIGTQMIVEGISFVDEDIKAIRFYRSMAPEQIAQLSFRARKSHVKPPISFYQSRENFFIAKDCKLSTVYDRLVKECAKINWNELGHPFVGDTAMLIGIKRVSKEGKSKDIETPLIVDPTNSLYPEASKLLLGYFTLNILREAMSADLFSLLSALRKWNFTFKFTKAEKTTAREEFRKMEIQRQRDIISSRFNEITKYSYKEVSQNKKNVIFKAWTLLQCVDPAFFNQWCISSKQSGLFFREYFFCLS